jgi:cytoskeletal protein CcmA (bactofilin family)
MWRKSSESKPSSPDTQPASNVAESSSSAPFRPHRESSDSLAESAANSSRLTPGLIFRGDFSGSSDLYVDAAVEGKIQLAQSQVTIGPNGRVQAELLAREARVQGSLKGNLRADDRIVLGPASRVRGNLTTRRIHIEEGATLNGKVEMDSGKAGNSPTTRPTERKAKELDSVLSAKQEGTK